VLLLLIMAGALLLEHPLSRLRSHCLERRLSGHWPAWEKPMARLISFVLLFFYAAALLITLIWGLAAQWRYPDVLPSRFSLDKVADSLTQLSDPLWCTLLLATLSALLAIIVVVGCLENEVRLKYGSQKVRGQKILLLLYLPLLIPQIAFIFGFQVWLIRVGLDGTFVALLWSHLIFVVPYVFLTLSGPYRQFDDRYSWLALSLTGRRAHSFWRIKLIILLRPILYAFATGFAVSIAQYLPTIFVGAGRFATLTTEAVALASGSDRRLMAVMALWQQLLPLIVFALATLIPVYRFRHRRAMSQTAS
jgi:putative thiamine transport system permease protein